MVARLLITTGLLTLATPAGAQDLPRIGVFNISIAGLDPALSDTAIDALATALGDLGLGEVLTAAELNALIEAEQRAEVLGCDDVTCMVEIGAAAGVDRLVAGSLGRVKRTIVLSLQLIDVQRSRVLNRVTLKWPGDESELVNLLGAGAELLTVPDTRRQGGTLSIAGGPGGATYKVGQRELDGTDTDLDVGVYDVRVEAPGYRARSQPAIVRMGEKTVIEAGLVKSDAGNIVGLGLQAGAFIPLGEAYSGDRTGLAIDVMYWLEIDFIAIPFRVGIRFDTRDDDEVGDYLEMAFDIGATWMIFNAAVTPFIGAGIGGRWLQNETRQTITVGSVFTTTTEKTIRDEAFGFGGYARAGLLFFRHSGVRLMLSGDYNFAVMPEDRTPQSFHVHVGFVF